MFFQASVIFCIFARPLNAKHHIIVKKILYEKPSCEEFLILTEGCIAGSPDNGGNENVGYEDWPIGLSGVSDSIFN